VAHRGCGLHQSHGFTGGELDYPEAANVDLLDDKFAQQKPVMHEDVDVLTVQMV